MRELTTQELNHQHQETIKPWEVTSNEKFVRGTNASGELSALLKEELGRQVNKRYLQGASVFFLPEILGFERTEEDGGPSLEAVLQKVRENNLEVAVYIGGINWRGGEHLHGTEIIGSKGKPIRKMGIVGLSKELSSDLSHDITIPAVKKEEEKPSALNYFVDAGKAVVITIDPEYQENKIIASSLRSDAIARQTITNHLRNYDIKDIEVVNWSDGGYKDIQIQFAGYIAIVDDIRYALQNGITNRQSLENMERALHNDNDEKTKEGAKNALTGLLLKVRNLKNNIKSENYTPPEKAHIKQHLREPVFFSGYQALNYFESLRDVDTIRGGAPAIPSELAFPFKSTDKSPLIRGPLRNLANYLLELFGTHESNQILDAVLYGKLPKSTVDQQGNTLVIFRLLELGRGKMTMEKGKEVPVNEIACRLTQKVIELVRQGGRDITLGDTSGSVVNSASETIGAPVLSQLINGKKALYLETRDLSEPGYPSLHIEIKNALGEVESFAAAAKLGLITDNTDTDPNKRYIPVKLSEVGRHPNGSVLHEARKIDYAGWDKLQDAWTNGELSEVQKKLMVKASLLFQND